MISRQKDHEKFAGFVQVFFVDLLLQKARLVMTSGLAQSSVFSKSSFLVTLMFCISPNRVLPLRRRLKEIGLTIVIFLMKAATMSSEYIANTVI